MKPSPPTSSIPNPKHHISSSDKKKKKMKDKEKKENPDNSNPNPPDNPNKSPNLKRPRTPPPPPPMSKVVALPSPSNGRKRGGKSRDQDDEEDAVTILNAVIDFRSKHGGSAPTPTTMKPVFYAVKDSLHHDITIDQLYNKFRTLKHHYYKAVNTGVGPTPFDRKFFDLSVKAWGEKRPPSKEMMEDGGGADENIKDEKKKKSNKKAKTNTTEEDNGNAPKAEEEYTDDDDAAHLEKYQPKEEAEENYKGEHGASATADTSSFIYVIDQARQYWEKEGMSVSDLELGLKFMDKSKAAALDKKWRQQFELGLKCEAKSFDLKKDIITALITGQKGGSS